MKLGYNTNGLANHDPFAGLQLLAETGYESVALTVDHHFLNPDHSAKGAELMQLKDFLSRHSMQSVVETGARFLLDPRTKHAPTLIDPDQENANRRIEYIKYCIDIAAELQSQCVSIWSGPKFAGDHFPEALDRLSRNLEPVLRYADEKEIDIGFEPEPGMLIDTTGRFERLTHLVQSDRLKMTMDIGHLFCLSEVPIASYIEKWQDYIVNVHIEDMIAGVHDHLMFGEGQIYFPPVIESLVSIGYQGGIHVELSRHSHDACNAVENSYQFSQANHRRRIGRVERR